MIMSARMDYLIIGLIVLIKPVFLYSVLLYGYNYFLELRFGLHTDPCTCMEYVELPD